MKNTGRLLLVISFFLLLLPFSWAQPMMKKVSFQYHNQKLGKILNDLSASHNLLFVYSGSFVPVDQKVTVNVMNKPLYRALDRLFEATPVVYAPSGGQIMLRVDKYKRVQKVSKLEPPKRKVRQMSPIYPLTPSEKMMLANLRQKREKYMNVSPIRKSNPQEVVGGKREEPRMDDYRLPTFELKDVAEDKRLAQISIFSSVGTNLRNSEDITNNVSVNVLWGTNGGVEGLEVGGLVNSVTEDVKGVQVAGLGNKVGGDVVGTQVAGLFNVNKGEVKGWQTAGLYNVSGETDAVQTSGLFNISKSSSGFQGAGLFNMARGKSKGVQMASLFNISRDTTRTQLAALFNIGGDVSWGQASALLNVGKNVRGFQFGLINVADTVSGSSIGLINIVKKGYNRVELSSGDALHANFALKLGSHAFYNIFQVGARWDELNIDNNTGVQEQGVFRSWGLGYGFGSTVPFGTRSLMNIEAVAMHINEMETWTDRLNLLTQLRFLLEIRLGKKFGIFGGPVGNLMVSNLYDPDTGRYGSIIAPYSLYEKTSAKGTNVKAWVGFNAGIRF